MKKSDEAEMQEFTKAWAFDKVSAEDMPPKTAGMSRSPQIRVFSVMKGTTVSLCIPQAKLLEKEKQTSGGATYTARLLT